MNTNHKTPYLHGTADSITNHKAAGLTANLPSPQFPFTYIKTPQPIPSPQNPPTKSPPNHTPSYKLHYIKMPMYEIEHITPLSPSQKDALAASITQIHSNLFTTPSLFVNVRFTDISGQDLYVGGKRVCRTKCRFRLYVQLIFLFFFRITSRMQSSYIYTSSPFPLSLPFPFFQKKNQIKPKKPKTIQVRIIPPLSYLYRTPQTASSHTSARVGTALSRISTRCARGSRRRGIVLFLTLNKGKGKGRGGKRRRGRGS